MSEESKGRNLNRTMEEITVLLSLLSNRTQDDLLRGCTAHSGLSLSASLDNQGSVT